MEDNGDDRIAVVLCTRDRPAFAEAALDAIGGALRAGDELVMVDSASQTPATVAVAERLGVRAVRVERPGLSVARNAGVAATTAPVVAFTDDDCTPDPGWLGAIASAFAADASLGFVMGRVVADRPGGAVSVIEDDQPRSFRRGDDILAVGHGANMSVRRAALAQVGEFDELLGAGARFPAGEDTDMVWRLLGAGWTGRYEPGALVTHRQWRDRSAVMRLEYGYGKGAGALAAKMRRLSPAEGAAFARRLLWTESLKLSLRHLVAGHRHATATCALRFGGTVVGLVAGSRTGSAA